MKNSDVGALVKEVEEMAKNEADGHVSMLKFTTGWKVFFGTPNLDVGEEREKIGKLQSFESLEEALQDLIVSKKNVWNVNK